MQTQLSWSLVGFHPAQSNQLQEMIDSGHKGKNMANCILDDIHFILRSPKCGKKISSQHHIAGSIWNYWHEAGWIQAYTLFTPNCGPTIKIMTENATHPIR